MQKENAKAPLLEALQAGAGCTYLSDLHHESVQNRLLTVLASIPPDCYSADEWNEAVRYICGTQNKPRDAAGARDVLMNFLIEK